MKYLYKGMGMPGWGDVSGSVLLGWHEKVCWLHFGHFLSTPLTGDTAHRGCGNWMHCTSYDGPKNCITEMPIAVIQLCVRFWPISLILYANVQFRMIQRSDCYPKLDRRHLDSRESRTGQPHIHGAEGSRTKTHTSYLYGNTLMTKENIAEV